jgi:hypothetical protein
MAIICAKCQHDNPADTLYCGKCGSPTKPEENLHFTKTILAGPETLQKGQVLADRYKIIEKLGRGGDGSCLQSGRHKTQKIGRP